MVDVAPLIDKLKTGVFIDGQWREAEGGKTVDVINPATEEVIAKVADGSAKDAQEAIEAAGRAQESWGRTAPRERAELLRRAYEILIDRQDEIAAIMSAEMGKSLAEAKGEVAYGAEFFRWFSEEASRIGGNFAISPDGSSRIQVSHEPIGPAILITPWNFPLAMGTRKIGPAIAAGCTMVFKPAKLTPLTSFALVQALIDAGLPDGVLNVVTSDSASRVVSPWIESGIARKITFTGSTEVGVKLLEQAAQRVLKSSMELGGNAPLIVAEDADLDKAVAGTLAAKMRNIGEACTSANRLYVHRSLADEFARRLAEKMSAMKVGNGLDEGVEVGPLVDPKQLAKVTELVDDAVTKGAKVLTGGKAIEGTGYFFQPTVLTDIPDDAEISSTEIFGPVATIFPFDSDEEAIAKANDTDLGLAGYIFTENVGRANWLTERLQVGMIGLNTGIVSNPGAPFGGVKLSGLGREGGRVGIEEFLETKFVLTPRS